MPQLDSVTYLGQVTWFVLVFGRYFLVMTGEVLPRLDRALKLRTKKLALTRGDARQFDREGAMADEAYGRSVAQAASSSAGLLTSCQDTQAAWVHGAVSSIRQGQGAPMTEAHQRALGTMRQATLASGALAAAMDVEVEMDIEEEAE